jgi:hypothetical protein
MSLTSELKQANSAVSQFFNYFNFNDLIKSENLQLRNSETLLPENQEAYPWSLVGHVTEYLIDLYLGVSIETLFPMRYYSNKRDSFYLNTVSQYSQNKLKDLPKIINILFQLAQVEAALRSKQPTPQFKNASDIVVKDVSKIFNKVKANPYLNPKVSYKYNPLFQLGNLVGGADADLIKQELNNNTLIDFKTSKEAKINNSMIHQLLGYYFLDNPSQYQLKNLAIYLTRQDRVLTWDIKSLICDHSHFTDLKSARSEFIANLYSPNKLKPK